MRRLTDATHVCTVPVLRMAHRKWTEFKQQPSMLPGSAVPGCCLVSFHFLWAIHPIFMYLAVEECKGGADWVVVHGQGDGVALGRRVDSHLVAPQRHVRPPEGGDKIMR